MLVLAADLVEENESERHFVFHQKATRIDNAKHAKGHTTGRCLVTVKVPEEVSSPPLLL